MKLCLFSVSHAGLWGQHKLDLEESIAKTAGLGYDSIMLMGKRPHLSPLDYDEDRLDKLRGWIDSHGIDCSVIGGYTDFAGNCAREVPGIEMQIAYVESLARMASRLGAKIVRVFTSYETDHESVACMWDRVILALQESCDRASKYGVIIAVQNHHDIGVAPEAMLQLHKEVDRDNCKLGIDAWSMSLLGYDPYEWARKLAPHTVITTNADYVRIPRHNYRPDLVNYEPAPAADLLRAVPFGEGFIDYVSFFSGLRDGGFNGVATYETCSPLQGGGSQKNLDDYAKRYLSWMRQNVLSGGS